MTAKPWGAELNAVDAGASARIAGHYAGLGRACRTAAEAGEQLVFDRHAAHDPIEYLESREDTFLFAVLQAVEAGRLDLAGEIVRNLAPLYETRSHLVRHFGDRWNEIVRVVSAASVHEPDSEARGIVLIQLARRERIRNRWDAAREKAAEAVAWCVARPGDSRIRLLEAEARETLGEAHRSYGSATDLDEAIAQFTAGLASLADAEATDRERRSLELKLRDRLGYALYLRGHLARAVAQLARSLRLHDDPSTDPAELSRTLNNLGKVLGARGRRRAARRCFTCSLAIKRARHDMRGEAVCLHEIGLLFREDCDIDRAIENLRESLRLKRAIDDAHGIGLSEMELGFTYERIGSAEQAIEHFGNALQFLTVGSAQYDRVRAHLGGRTHAL